MEPQRGKIRWDEEAIREHDQQRGQKMKITEPKTPYHYYDEEDDPDAAEPPSLNEHELEDELEKVRKKQEFLEKRRAHYDEFHMVRQMRRRSPEEDEEES